MKLEEAYAAARVGLEERAQRELEIRRQHYARHDGPQNDEEGRGAEGGDTEGRGAPTTPQETGGECDG